MSAGSFVATRAIQQAVRGRETEVLDALGIAWDRGSPHIACPYPGHTDDNPSWRWDERKARAFCTCIERPHSILDVVMKVESVDFEAAKLRVAEILGRQDLIKVKDGQRHQQWTRRASSDRRRIGATISFLGRTSRIASAS